MLRPHQAPLLRPHPRRLLFFPPYFWGHTRLRIFLAGDLSWVCSVSHLCFDVCFCLSFCECPLHCLCPPVFLLVFLCPNPVSHTFFVSPVCRPAAHRNNNLTFLRPYYQTEEGEENPFICSSRRDNGMQKCSHIPSRRELRVECTLGWEAYGQPQADGTVGAARNACINWNQYYNVCRSGGSNPHNGAISFDNIGYAWIAIFQVGPGPPAEGSGHCMRRGAGGTGEEAPVPSRGRRVCSRLPPQVITLEGWVDIMYYVMDAHSFYNFIYFILLIIVSVGAGPVPGAGWGVHGHQCLWVEVR